MSSRGNPFEEIEKMFERMNRQFGNLGAQMGDQLGGISVDVADHGDEYVVTADLPGFSQEDITVELEDDVLHLSAEREEDRETGGDDEQFIHRERTRQSVSRSVRLPEAVRDEEAEAAYRNGVLTVTLPKRQGGADTGTDIPIN